MPPCRRARSAATTSHSSRENSGHSCRPSAGPSGAPAHSTARCHTWASARRTNTEPRLQGLRRVLAFSDGYLDWLSTSPRGQVPDASEARRRTRLEYIDGWRALTTGVDRKAHSLTSTAEDVINDLIDGSIEQFQPAGDSTQGQGELVTSRVLIATDHPAAGTRAGARRQISRPKRQRPRCRKQPKKSRSSSGSCVDSMTSGGRGSAPTRQGPSSMPHPPGSRNHARGGELTDETRRNGSQVTLAQREQPAWLSPLIAPDGARRRAAGHLPACSGTLVLFRFQPHDLINIREVSFIGFEWSELNNLHGSSSE